MLRMRRILFNSKFQIFLAEQTTLLLNLANGMPLTAIELHQSDWLQKRAVFLSDWFKLVTEKNMPFKLFKSSGLKELNFSEFMTMFEYLLLIWLLSN